MIRLIKAVIVVSVIIIAAYFITTGWDKREQEKISNEQLRQYFESITDELDVKIIDYEVEFVEGKRRLKVKYETNIEKENNKLLGKQKQALYKKITDKKIFEKGLDRVWFLAKKDGEYVINSSMNVIKPMNQMFIYQAFSFYIAIMAVIIYFFRDKFRGYKRNKYLEGDTLEEYSLAELEMYVETNKRDDLAHYRIAQLLAIKKEYAEAKESIEKAIKLNPRVFGYRRVAGNICYELQEYKQAIKYYKGSQELLTLHKDYDYYFRMGKAYIKSGKKAKGLEYFQKAKKIIKNK